MSVINKINGRILQVSDFIEDYSNKLREFPKDRSLSVMIKDLESQLKELQSQLHKENANRFKEVFELRLIGDKAQLGTLPLTTVGDVVKPFASAVYNTSKFIQFGSKRGKIVDTMVTKTIDLRLEDIGVGSTILYVSGKTSPDLFGNSLIQSCIQQTYSFLESETNEEVFENIPKIGLRGVKELGNFFKVLAKEDLELEFGWDSPFDKRYQWEGDYNRINNLYLALNQVVVSTPEVIPFSAEIISMSLRGRLEVFTFDDERIICRFPLELIEYIRLFHLGDKCDGVMLKNTYINKTTGAEKHEYTLQSIKDR